ncbi:autotransporter outer membrane beta-barrel domain-containing protein, partial [Fusobacterium ulcerans]
MIEKIMRAVKSNNKKRGRNITIGAVVGILLSCSAVMGAEGNYLWIKNNSGTIEFSTNGNPEGTGEIWTEEDPYNSKNSWNGKTYINNMALSGKENGEDADGNIIGYGLRLNGNLKEVEFINNGSILGDRKSSYGIYNYGGNIGSIKNNGTISGNYSGIYNKSEDLGLSNIGRLLNLGNISGDTGIYNYSYGSSTSSIGRLLNLGSISGDSSGISNSNSSSSTIIIGKLLNLGIISGDSSGISNYSYDTTSNSSIENLLNTGVIYGKDNAITNDGGTINNAVNYKLLVSSSGPVVQNNGGIVTFAKDNYGLAFKVESDGKYTLDSILSGKFGQINYNTDVVIGYEKDAKGKFDFNKPITEKYTIINAKAKGESSGSVSGTESLVLKDGILFHDELETSGIEDFSLNKKYILNGITDTLEVKGTGNKLNNSVINAYKTAVNMSADSNLTLGNTVINGGLDGTSPVVSMTGNNDLILKNTTINATKSSAISMAGTDNILSIEEKSIINGKIESAGANNTITIKESIINGDILATAGNNTLNLIGNRDEKRVVLYNNTMNIFHNIDGFENINIGNNVAFYEDAKITNVEKLNIEKDGILVLRIDSTKKDGSGIKGHALYNIGTTISSKGGKLLLALNGAGNTETINFGTTVLADSIKGTEAGLSYQEDFTIDTTSYFHSVERVTGKNEVKIVVQSDLPMFRSIYEYDKLNGIYRGIISIDELGNFAVNTPENLSTFLSYLNDIYAGNPYSYSSELSRKSTGMFRDIVVDNIFRPEKDKWMIYGGLTHVDGGTKDTYYGKGYYTYDIGSNDMDADTKITGAYMLGEYGVSDTLTSGVVIGGNKLKSDLSNGSKVDGSAMYLGAYAKKYVGNLKVTAGAGFQYGDYDADRMAVNRVASDTEMSVMKYSDNYNDMTYDIYLN